MGLGKLFLNFGLCFLLGFSPALTYAAAAEQNLQASLLKDYYKRLDYKAGGDVDQWLNKNSNQMHFKMRVMLQKLHMAHPNLKLPSIEFSDYEVGGKTVTRMILKFDKEQQVVDVRKSGDKLVLNAGGQDFTYEDIYYNNILDAGDMNPMLNQEQLKRASEVNFSAAVNYQKEFRNLVGSLASFSEQDQPEVQKQFSYVDWILQTAYATEKDGECIVGGNFTMIAKNGYCGGGAGKDLYCEGSSKKGFSCNALVYGLSPEGKNFCVPVQPNKSPATYVSDSCNSHYPLTSNDSQKKYIDSVLKSYGPEAEFYKKLNDHIQSAGKKCGVAQDSLNNHIKEGAKEGRIKTYEEADFLKAFPAHSAKNKKGEKFDYNQGHRTACKFLMNRLLLAKQAADCSEKRTLAADSPDAKEKSEANKDCNIPMVAVVGQPVTENTDPLICKKVEEQSKVVASDVQSGKIKLSDPRVQQITADRETHQCAFDWPPKEPEAKPVVTAVAPKVEKEDKNWCTESTSHKWTCGLGILALLAWLFRDKGGNGATVASTTPLTPPPMTVGKPGESMVPNQRPTNRPAAATPSSGTN